MSHPTDLPRVPSSSTLRSPSPLSVAVAHPSFESSSIDHSSQFLRSRSASPARRGRSPGPKDNALNRLRSHDADTWSHSQSHSWWNSRELLPRPRHESPKGHKSIPPEQSERWLSTRKKVANAAVSILGTTADVVHEVLLVTADALEFAPIPGLHVAAHALLEIWDAVILVETNRLSCLRLTERCADLLMCVRAEIHDAGDYVGEELVAPLAKLVECFSQVYRLLRKQINRPFIKRYLKRDDVLKEIKNCDRDLISALGMFSISVQIRTLRQVQDSERQRQSDTRALINAVLDFRSHPAAQPDHLLLNDVDPQQSPTDLQAPRSDEVVAAWQLLQTKQNLEDRHQDLENLRQIMRKVLQTKNDAELIDVLQVSKLEMPEAIKSLQRALEREVEKEQDGSGSMITKVVPVFEEHTEPPSSLSKLRSDTMESTQSHWSDRTQASGNGSTKARTSKDTLDREFLENGIDALRRMSQGTVLTLPSWTITKYEVDRDEKIGVGFFSDVYRGTWRNKTVAIKVLAPTAPRKLFVHEVGIWKTLSHPNVLGLLGASSTFGETPWFFVSPYMKNGSLVMYLKGLPSLDQANPLRMICEVANGMKYLHEKGVLHGDLKAANVLVDDDIRCVISDFGQSELKSEVSRISAVPFPHGTLRWQAPELMTGQSKLTQEMDVYAFAISCIEILTKGDLPWPHMDDDSVRYFSLKENLRPEIPAAYPWSKALALVISACWHRSPTSRPPFSRIVSELKNIGLKYNCQLLSPLRLPESDPLPKKSPDMHPIPIPIVSSAAESIDYATDGSFNTVPSGRSSASLSDTSVQLRDTTKPYIHSNESESSFSMFPDSSSDPSRLQSSDGRQSPPPINEERAEIRNERRYRLLLQHEYHPSLTLPLWTPSPVTIGAVGYLSKPDGAFVTLFDAFDPPKTSNGKLNGMPSLYGYGRVNQGNQRQDKRNAAQRGLDVIQSWLSSKRDTPSFVRRYSFGTRSGHKTAFLCTETTMYRYMDDLASPKQWFKANVDDIMAAYAVEHHITKEELFLVIGTLSAPDYALFVSHNHPDGQVHFNVYGGQKTGRPWGTFAIDTDLANSTLGGPVYHEEQIDKLLSANKVSAVDASGPWDTLLLARLRFKPDVPEPTSL